MGEEGGDVRDTVVLYIVCNGMLGDLWMCVFVCVCVCVCVWECVCVCGSVCMWCVCGVYGEGGLRESVESVC